MTLLLVDDDSVFLEGASRLLAKAGHEIVIASNGLEALQQLNANPHIRFVLCDWEMPQMNGIELCRAIRAARGFEIYVIMITGRRAASHVDGLYAGADDFITKPFETAHLLNAVLAAELVLNKPTRRVG